MFELETEDVQRAMMRRGPKCPCCPALPGEYHTPLCPLSKQEWDIEQTGGGCSALKTYWLGRHPESTEAWITDLDGMGVPEGPDEPVLLGFYDSEGEPLVMFECPGTATAALIARHFYSGP